jgi:hypothetical protein
VQGGLDFVPACQPPDERMERCRVSVKAIRQAATGEGRRRAIREEKKCG